MPIFFVKQDKIKDDSITITGEDAKHISLSLRMKTGESITICDGEKNNYHCVINRIDKSEVNLKILSYETNNTEPPYEITLYQALIKGDRFDYVIQKSVEFGATRIVPVYFDRCIYKIGEGNLNNKILRWNKISAEAACQCRRGIIPVVQSPLSFKDAIEDSSANDINFICNEREKNNYLNNFLNKIYSQIGIFIGPEGGICDHELLLAISKDVKSVSLGNRILRSESVSGYCLSVLSYVYETNV